MSAKKPTENDDPQITSLAKMGDEVFIPFGIPELDALTGGVPVGRITELWGSEGTGKTHTLGQIMAANTDKKILVIDAEFALNRARLESFGANVENIDVMQDARLERVCDFLLANIGKYDIIMLDSLAYLTPQTVEENEIGVSAIGLFSRLIKNWVVKLRPMLGRSKTALVVVNQYRKPIGMYAKPEVPGGKAWDHAVDVRLYMTANSGDKLEKQVDGKKARVGHWVNVEVKKSKVSSPFKTTKYKVIY